MASIAVPPRFVRDRTGRLQLYRGDLRFLAEQTGFSAGHLSRCISGDRVPTDELKQQLEQLTGCPIGKIDLPAKSS